MKTFMAKEADIKRKWYLVDAEGKHLGRMASEVAKILRGKTKPEYTPFVDTGDHVIIINAEKVVLTGKKLDQKLYRRHTGHPGGFKETVYRIFMKENPEKVVELAVKGMLPHNHLGREMAKKLKVYKGSEHKHQAQQPEKLELDI
ncbi:MAG: 50S ribosomal protein L13 [Eubacteriales bacterium]|nr:50S ribosomal protein L13 [Eubacteriales bacterium]